MTLVATRYVCYIHQTYTNCSSRHDLLMSCKWFVSVTYILHARQTAIAGPLWWFPLLHWRLVGGWLKIAFITFCFKSTVLHKCIFLNYGAALQSSRIAISGFLYIEYLFGRYQWRLSQTLSPHFQEGRKTLKPVHLSVNKTLIWSRTISSGLMKVEHSYLEHMILVTKPLKWHNAVTLTFDLVLGQV